jgi:hypothetical protein
VLAHHMRRNSCSLLAADALFRVHRARRPCGSTSGSPVGPASSPRRAVRAWRCCSCRSISRRRRARSRRWSTISAAASC